ncbi:MAG: DUF1284 domain-containing protein [Gammaproteobacteria bacterium]|nr:DUF1284 domain-containing protein [Gammaproteobacteria bacterium]
MRVNFRPHHFLCALTFQGKGYSQPFIENFAAIMTLLNKNEANDVLIEVVLETDSICTPCPHRSKNRCATQSKIERLDAAHQQVLGVNAGDLMTWKAARQLMKDKLSMAQFHEICKDCEWKIYGMCETTLKAFLS